MSHIHHIRPDCTDILLMTRRNLSCEKYCVYTKRNKGYFPIDHDIEQEARVRNRSINITIMILFIFILLVTVCFPIHENSHVYFITIVKSKQ